MVRRVKHVEETMASNRETSSNHHGREIACVTISESLKEVMDPQNYSCYTRMIRIMALIIKFKDNSISSGIKNKQTFLTLEELTDADYCVVRIAQLVVLGTDITLLKPSRKLFNVHPYLQKKYERKEGWTMQTFLQKKSILPYRKQINL